MMLLDIADNDLLTMDTLSGLEDETVEIWEHETVRTVRLNGYTPHTQDSGRSPKLVIDDDPEGGQVFITKAPSTRGLLSELIGKGHR